MVVFYSAVQIIKVFYHVENAKKYEPKYGFGLILLRMQRNMMSQKQMC